MEVMSLTSASRLFGALFRGRCGHFWKPKVRVCLGILPIDINVRNGDSL